MTRAAGGKARGRGTSTGKALAVEVMTGSVIAPVPEPEAILSLRVPLAFPRRGGRKLVVTSDGTTEPNPDRSRIDSTLVKALARAHRWQRLLDSGRYATVQDLAKAERINLSYLARILRLTLLAPDIVEAILDGTQPAGLALAPLLRPFPVEWTEQKLTFRLIT